MAFVRLYSAGAVRARSVLVPEWIEVVATDQVAAVVTKYDPITGWQIPTS